MLPEQGWLAVGSWNRTSNLTHFCPFPALPPAPGRGVGRPLLINQMEVLALDKGCHHHVTAPPRPVSLSDRPMVGGCHPVSLHWCSVRFHVPVSCKTRIIL